MLTCYRLYIRTMEAIEDLSECLKHGENYKDINLSRKDPLLVEEGWLPMYKGLKMQHEQDIYPFHNCGVLLSLFYTALVISSFGIDLDSLYRLCRYAYESRGRE